MSVVKLTVVLCITVIPADFRSSCNSFQLTAGFSLSFFLISLRDCCSPAQRKLLVAPSTFQLHNTEPVALKRMFKVFVTVLWIFSLKSWLIMLKPENFSKLLHLHRNCCLVLEILLTMSTSFILMPDSICMRMFFGACNSEFDLYFVTFTSRFFLY